MEPFYLAAKEAGTVNKKTIAHALDISPRTIQRRLEQSSTSFSTIIDLVRFDKAQRLIKYSDLTMLEISLMLGHQNASSFTRSFRRLSGVSPKKFRLFGIEES
jgi:AraC-like DNA-binding protein